MLTEDKGIPVTEIEDAASGSAIEKMPQLRSSTAQLQAGKQTVHARLQLCNCKASLKIVKTRILNAGIVGVGSKERGCRCRTLGRFSGLRFRMMLNLFGRLRRCHHSNH
jgi:hypothetical protein